LYDAAKTANGETLQRRHTYMEIGTQSQLPPQPCNVHGEPRARLARFFSSSDLPRAALAVDLSEITPIAIKSPTLLADTDPYNSLKPTLKLEPAAEPAIQPAANQKSDSTSGEGRVKTANVSGSSNGTGPPPAESAPAFPTATP